LCGRRRGEGVGGGDGGPKEVVCRGGGARRDTAPHRDDQGTDIDILIDKISDRITRVSIRVGAFGDEAVSRLILDEIQRNL
jgi:hypothetical protein